MLPFPGVGHPHKKAFVGVLHYRFFCGTIVVAVEYRAGVGLSGKNKLIKTITKTVTGCHGGTSYSSTWICDCCHVSSCGMDG